MYQITSTIYKHGFFKPVKKENVIINKNKMNNLSNNLIKRLLLVQEGKPKKRFVRVSVGYEIEMDSCYKCYNHIVHGANIMQGFFLNFDPVIEENDNYNKTYDRYRRTFVMCARCSTDINILYKHIDQRKWIQTFENRYSNYIEHEDMPIMYMKLYGHMFYITDVDIEEEMIN
uniref:Uncharacterized protein n=1 Tax=viral metagenome TaxID=1070528 RepID=A0A6C0CR35_9ZZZZ